MKQAISPFLPTVAGVLSGTLAAFAVTFALVQPELRQIEERLGELGRATSTPVTTPLEPPVQIVPIESRPLLPSYPPAFLERKVSSVLNLVRRGRADGQPVSNERILGSAVALTSDGWLATSRRAVEGLRLNDLSVAWNGKVYPVRRATRDTSTDVAYLKIDVNNLPTTAFARASDVQSGAAVWLESHPGQLRADLVIDASIPSTMEAVTSERAGRRFLVQGNERLASGTAVWDGGGKLVGVTDTSDANGTVVIPAEGMGSTLAQLINTGAIQRPLLGIRGLDLAHMTLDTASSSLPTIGTWVRSVPNATPAYRNLAENDVIERIERDILDGTADLGETLHDYRPGATVTLYGRRNGEAFQARVTLGTQNTAETIR